MSHALDRWIYALVLIYAVVLGGCAQLATTARPAESPFRPVASIVGIMDGVVDPAADALWASYAFDSNMQGTVWTRPQSDDDWEKVRREAVALIEGANLLMIEGRVVEQPGEKREDPMGEGDLTPTESLRLIESQRTVFNNMAHILQAAGDATIKAIDARNYKTLDRALADIDQACESCHKIFWYPKAVAAR